MSTMTKRVRLRPAPSSGASPGAAAGHGLTSRLLCMWAGVALVATLCACGGVSQSAPPTSLVIFEVVPADASVRVDGGPPIRLADIHGALALQPGTRRVVLFREGFLPVRVDLELEDRDVVSLSYELWPALPIVDLDDGSF